MKNQELKSSHSFGTLDSLWFIDSELKDQSGHYSDFAEGLIGEARQHQLEVIVAGNRYAEASLVKRLAMKTAFHGMIDSFVPLGKIGYPLNPIIGSWVYYRELCGALPAGGSGAVALAATANHRHFAALARWLSRFPAGRAPILIIYIRFNYLDPVTNSPLAVAPLIRRGMRMLERAALSRNIVLITDSEQLAEEYRRITSLAVATLGLPSMIPQALLKAAPSPAFRKAGPLRFSYLGEARIEKGYDLLVDSIRVLQERGELNDIRIAIHSYHHPMYRVGRWQKKLEEMEHPSVVSVGGPLDSESYYRWLLESDVIVLPYRRSTYFARSSAIFVDALAAGKPVITTNDTWMSEQLKHFGAGILCKENDAADLARALVEAKRSFAHLSALGASGKDRWIQSHTMKEFFVRMMTLANQARITHSQESAPGRASTRGENER